PASRNSLQIIFDGLAQKTPLLIVDPTKIVLRNGSIQHAGRRRNWLDPQNERAWEDPEPGAAGIVLISREYKNGSARAKFSVSGKFEGAGLGVPRKADPPRPPRQWPFSVDCTCTYPRNLSSSSDLGQHSTQIQCGSWLVKKRRLCDKADAKARTNS